MVLSWYSTPICKQKYESEVRHISGREMKTSIRNDYIFFKLEIEFLRLCLDQGFGEWKGKGKGKGRGSNGSNGWIF